MQKFLRPSPLAPSPLREKGTRKLIPQPLLPKWEKGLGDEGAIFALSKVNE